MDNLKSILKDRIIIPDKEIIKIKKIIKNKPYSNIKIFPTNQLPKPSELL